MQHLSSPIRNATSEWRAFMANLEAAEEKFARGILTSS
jgi:hypothetical protein